MLLLSCFCQVAVVAVSKQIADEDFGYVPLLLVAACQGHIHTSHQNVTIIFQNTCNNYHHDISSWLTLKIVVYLFEGLGMNKKSTFALSNN